MIGALTSLVGGAVSTARAVVLPWWAKWAAIAVLALATYAIGRVHEARVGADKFLAHVQAEARATARIARATGEVVRVTETVYRDRIKHIYHQGATIETNVPTYIQPADLGRFAVNAGFVRVLDAAWSGTPAGPARDADREPAAVPIDDIARNQVHNATSCLAWREQAFGWRAYYAGLQKAVNGQPGQWYQPPPAALFLE